MQRTRRFVRKVDPLNADSVLLDSNTEGHHLLFFVWQHPAVREVAVFGIPTETGANL